MSEKTKPCHHFGDGPVIILVTVKGEPVIILVTPCHHFGDGLAHFYCPPCHHFGDILNNHTPRAKTYLPKASAIKSSSSSSSSSIPSAKQAGRPVDLKHRTDGLPAWLPVVPMPPFQGGGGTADGTFLFSLQKKLGGSADG